MNPNRLSRKLIDLPGNVHSSKFPGGSLVSAALDRPLMTWSDKGGASRRFGEIWSEYAWSLLAGNDPGIPARFREFTSILRLDADPRIAIQAGRHKLPNPDFLLFGGNGSSALEVRAIDAKFAIDRLRRTQISPESVRGLVELSGSLAKRELLSLAEVPEVTSIDYESGAFLAPSSLLNDWFYCQVTSGHDPELPASEIILVDARLEALFHETEEFDVMAMLREIDGFAEFEPGRDIVAGSYYFRLTCAAAWFEQQINTPLLSSSDPEPIPFDAIKSALRKRYSQSAHAYQLISDWSNAALRAAQQLNRVREAARLPLRMQEIRGMLERAGAGEDRKLQRQVRGALERHFLNLLVDEIGEVPAQPTGGVQDVIDRIHQVRRRLRPELKRYARNLIERSPDEPSLAAES